MLDAASTTMGLGLALSAHKHQRPSARNTAHHIPAFEFTDMLPDNTHLHLDCLEQVTIDIFPYNFLSFCPRKYHVALLQESADVPASNLALSLHLVLQLSQPLCGEPKLGLYDNISGNR